MHYLPTEPDYSWPVVRDLWPSEVILLVRGHLLANKKAHSDYMKSLQDNNKLLSNKGQETGPRWSEGTFTALSPAVPRAFAARLLFAQALKGQLPGKAPEPLTHLQLAHRSGWPWHQLWAQRCMTFPCQDHLSQPVSI